MNVIHCVTVTQIHYIVGHVCETEFATNMTFKVVTSIINFYIPTTCMTVLYVRMFLAIKRRSQDIERFGAYTASGKTFSQMCNCDMPFTDMFLINLGTASSKTASAGGVKNGTSARLNVKSNCNGLLESESHNSTLIVTATPKPPRRVIAKEIVHENIERDVSLLSSREAANKIMTEFHRLAVVAFPIEKEDLTPLTSKATASSCNGNAIVVTGRDIDEAKQQCHSSMTSAKVSCESLSVFDGVTVKIEYITDNVNNAVETGSKDKDIAITPTTTTTTSTSNSVSTLRKTEAKSSKELLLGLEERTKRAEGSTVPLRQPLSANYRSSVNINAVGGTGSQQQLPNGRPGSFIDRHQQTSASYCNHNSVSRRHSRHLHCYRSKKLTNNSVKKTTSASFEDPSAILVAASGDNNNLNIKQEAGGKTENAQDQGQGSPSSLSLEVNDGNNLGGSIKNQVRRVWSKRILLPSKRRRRFQSNDSDIKSRSLITSGDPQRLAKKANPNAALAKEKKAATQLGVIVGAFILCWLPYFTLFMVVAYCGQDKCVNDTVFTVTIWFGYFNSTLNPILYPLCNANFKRAFKRMLHLDNNENSVMAANGFAATNKAKRK